MWRILFALLLLPLNCFAQPITITSAGETFEEAKLNGFRTAVEYKLGTFVISEREQQNYKLVRNNIQTYSAGYVDSFRILSTVQGDKSVTLVMEVTVAESKLRDFLLTEPTNINQFNGTSHQAQIDTYFYEREKGDDLIRKLFSHYPKHAFSLRQRPYQLKTDYHRGIILVVPYEMRWNYNFLTALNETMRHTQDSEYQFFRPKYGRVIVQSKDPRDYILGNTSIYYFNDLNRIRLVKELMTGENEPRLLLTVSNLRRETIINTCVFPRYLTGKQRSFYGIGQLKELEIFGNEVETFEIKVELGRHRSINVNDINHITLNLVSNKDCPRSRYR